MSPIGVLEAPGEAFVWENRIPSLPHEGKSVIEKGLKEGSDEISQVGWDPTREMVTGEAGGNWRSS